jgi:hypothetical protein
MAAPFKIRAEAAQVATMLKGAVRLGPSRSGEILPLALALELEKRTVRAQSC